MAVDEAPSAPGSLALKWLVASSFFMNSIGDVGVGGKVFVGVDDDEGFRRKWCMVGDRTTKCRRTVFPRSDAECHSHDWKNLALSLKLRFRIDFGASGP